MDRRLSPVQRPTDTQAGNQHQIAGSPSPSRRTTANASPSVTGLTLSPLLGIGGSLMGGPRVTARRSWSPQHQSSLEVPTPRQIQSARNSLAATTTTTVRQQSVEVRPFRSLSYPPTPSSPPLFMTFSKEVWLSHWLKSNQNVMQRQFFSNSIPIKLDCFHSSSSVAKGQMNCHGPYPPLTVIVTWMVILFDTGILCVEGSWFDLPYRLSLSCR